MRQSHFNRPPFTSFQSLPHFNIFLRRAYATGNGNADLSIVCHKIYVSHDKFDTREPDFAFGARAFLWGVYESGQFVRESHIPEPTIYLKVFLDLAVKAFSLNRTR